jgi:hypothetical protein
MRPENESAARLSHQAARDEREIKPPDSTAIAARKPDNVVDLADDERGKLIGAKPPLVTPGTYELLYEFDETLLLSGGKVPKLVLWFRITAHGQFMGTKLPRYYNVTKIEGKPRRGGGFRVGWRSAFIRDFAAIFNSVPGRTNRIPMSRFEGVDIRGVVKTVVSTWNQQSAPTTLHYSVIERLLPPAPAVAVTPGPAPSPTPTLKEERGG